jgi:hypothetical protein
MMRRTGHEHGWRVATGLATLLICGALIAPAGAQQPGQGGGAQRREKPERGRPITLLVDAVEKRTWSPEELRGLATVKWTNSRDVEHPAIPLAALLGESGVALDRVKELRIRSSARTVTLEGDDLARVERLVLRTGRKANRPWRLVPLDPAEKDPFNLADVRRLEVVTRDQP